MPTATEINLILVAAAGVIVALTGLIVAVNRGVQQIREMRAENATMRRQVAEVHHEATPNGGSSMHDAVRLEIAPQLTELKQTVDVMASTVADFAQWREETTVEAAERRDEHDRRHDDLKKSMRGLQRDVGRVADGMMQLGQVDLADRQAAAEVHAVHDRRHADAERRLANLENRQPRS